MPTVPIELSTSRAIALALCTLSLLLSVAYSVGLHGPFVLDDAWNLATARVETLSVPALLDVARGNSSGPLGRPLAAISFAFNFALAGGDSFSFKVTNLAIHVINTSLVYLLCHRLLILTDTGLTDTGLTDTGLTDTGQSSEAKIRSDRWLAFFIASIWAAHPLQVSTVLYVVQRMTLLMGTFTFAALILYAEARIGQRDGIARGLPSLLAASLLAAVACFAKENGVLIAVYVLLIEAILLSRTKPVGPALRWHRFVLASCAIVIVGAIVLLFLRSASFVDAYAGRDFGPFGRLLSQLHALVLYLRMLLLPDPGSMTFYYDDIVAPTGFGREEKLAALVLVTLVVIAFYLGRVNPLVLLGVLFFFGGHLLESTVLPLELVFEHRNYVPSLGIALAIGAVMGTVWRWKARLRSGVVAIGMLMMVTLLFQTHSRALVWSDAIVLNYHATQQRPGSERAWISLASELAERGDVEGGLAVLKRAADVVRDPDFLPLQELQLVWWSGLHDEKLYRRALKVLTDRTLRPKQALLLSSAVELEQHGKKDYPTSGQLLALYDAAADSPRRLPAYLDATFDAQHYVLLVAAGRQDDAVNAITSASQQDPHNGEIALRHAEALVRVGRAFEAEGPLERALRRAPRTNERVGMRLERVRHAVAEARGRE